MILSKHLQHCVNDRPDEHQMKVFIEKAKELEEIVLAVAHIGVDFGFGKYHLDDEHIKKARELC